MSTVRDNILKYDYISALTVILTTSFTFTIGALWRDTANYVLDYYVDLEDDDEELTEKERKRMIRSIKTNILATFFVLILITLIEYFSTLMSGGIRNLRKNIVELFRMNLTSKQF